MAPGFLLEVAWKGSVILLAAGSVTLTLRRSSAAVRHLVWTTGLLSVLALPLVVYFGPSWRVAVLPARLVSRGVAQTPTEAIGPAAVAGVRSVVGAGPRDHAAGLTQHPQQVSTGRRAIDWPGVMAQIWAAGALFGLFRLAAGLIWAAWIARRATRIDDQDWVSLTADAANALGIVHTVPVFTTDRIGVPVACGIVRPKLLLPHDAARWETPLRRAVLLHELAHVKRHDCLVQAMGQLARAVHWLNPLAVLALARLRAEQERACDDLVLAAGVAAPDYANHLWEIARAFRPVASPGWATLAMARPSNLEGRLRAILDPTRARRSASRGVDALTAIVACAGVLACGTVRLTAVAAPMADRLTLATVAPTRADAPVEAVPEPAAAPSSPSTEDEGKRRIARVIVPAEPAPDFSGTWMLDASRSESPALRSSDQLRNADWGDTLEIRHTGTRVSVASRRGEISDSVVYWPDDHERRYVDERREVGGGVALRGRDVKSSWDGGKLVTLTRPFSAWQQDDDPSAVPDGSGLESVNIRSLSPDGQEMTVVRVNRHDWGWGFDGKEPSPAYVRITDIYRRVAP